MKKFVFGSWSLSGDYGYKNEKETIKTLLRAYQKGIIQYDTAPNYGYGYAEYILGKTYNGVCKPQHLVKGKTIFGSAVLEPNSYALVSCVVSPGFEFKDFELFRYDELIKEFPNYEEIIKRLTP